MSHGTNHGTDPDHPGGLNAQAASRALAIEFRIRARSGARILVPLPSAGVVGNPNERAL
jgi:hypothetical protein